MHIEIDDKSGFCFGVVRAISQAEEALAEGGTVYSLGDIVHNRIEVQRLEELGLHTVTHDRMEGIAGGRLLIRAHGEPPTTYERARKLGIHVIDATCPVVARLQRRVKQAYEAMLPVGGQVVILGKRGHAEVVGLTGQVDGPILVIERAEDLRQIDFARPIHFLSQTTQSIALFEELGAEMKRTRQSPRRRPHRRHDLPTGRQPRAVSHAVRRTLRCGDLRLRPQVLERKGSRPRSAAAQTRRPMWSKSPPRSTTVGSRGPEVSESAAPPPPPKWLMQQVADAIDKRTVQ